MPRVQPIHRPVDHPAGIGVERAIGNAHGAVVIATHTDRTLCDQRFHLVDTPARIGTIANQIAQKNQPVDLTLGKIGQNRLERLTVGMDIGQQCNPHQAPPQPVGFPRIILAR
ncbi:MAG: hypothetical protein ACD_54C00867G0006 [uncultured bacterium]|nr:MAG: hypothetical protein ACD_54C00867G0006 [uncultured bacterium]